MHELSLCSAIADIVTRRAADRPVDVIHLRIGQLRQVVPETLEFCWRMVTEGTALGGSVLEVERIHAVLHCRSCNAERVLGDDFVFACAECGGLDMDVQQGEECLVTSFDLAEV
jgi:hydrogenase nickel incorporation protein HypA/HybF